MTTRTIPVTRTITLESEPGGKRWTLRLPTDTPISVAEAEACADAIRTIIELTFNRRRTFLLIVDVSLPIDNALLLAEPVMCLAEALAEPSVRRKAKRCLRGTVVCFKDAHKDLIRDIDSLFKVVLANTAAPVRLAAGLGDAMQIADVLEAD